MGDHQILNMLYGLFLKINYFFIFLEPKKLFAPGPTHGEVRPCSFISKQRSANFLKSDQFQNICNSVRERSLI